MMDDVGIKIHKIKQPKLHVKVLFCHNNREVIESVTRTAGRFDKRRELAIEQNDGEAIDRLHRVVRSDWENCDRILTIKDRRCYLNFKFFADYFVHNKTAEYFR